VELPREENLGVSRVREKRSTGRLKAARQVRVHSGGRVFRPRERDGNLGKRVTPVQKKAPAHGEKGVLQSNERI